MPMPKLAGAVTRSIEDTSIRTVDRRRRTKSPRGITRRVDRIDRCNILNVDGMPNALSEGREVSESLDSLVTIW
ncbi:MAG: hypothetical protein WD473_11700 [Acidimicrobiia bacterium]